MNVPNTDGPEPAMPDRSPLGDLRCIAVAVRDLEAAIDTYCERLGFHQIGPTHTSQRGYNMRWVELSTAAGGPPTVELLQPTGDGPVQRFIDRVGEGVYQVRFGVDGVAEASDSLRALGAAVVDDPSPGVDATRLAWVHPRTTHGVLIELMDS